MGSDQQPSLPVQSLNSNAILDAHRDFAAGDNPADGTSSLRHFFAANRLTYGWRQTIEASKKPLTHPRDPRIPILLPIV
jgi:hypothetical protein